MRVKPGNLMPSYRHLDGATLDALTAYLGEPPMSLPNALPRPPDELRRLEAVWESPQGWRAITDVNNTRIGLLYLGTALVFLVLGGLLGLVMRAQLAVPGNTVVAPTPTTRCSPCMAA